MSHLICTYSHCHKLDIFHPSVCLKIPSHGVDLGSVTVEQEKFHAFVSVYLTMKVGSYQVLVIVLDPGNYLLRFLVVNDHQYGMDLT